MSRLLPWVNDADLADEPTLLNLRLPVGITLADIAAAATDHLWAASAARYGLRQVTVRPSRLTPSCGADSSVLGPLGTGYGHAPTDVREVHLEGPASNVAVTVEGLELDPSAWVLVDGYRLIRVGSYWPCCQDLSLPDGGPGTWSIAHSIGIDPPPLGRLAAREMAIQLALYHSGRDSKLPKGTSSVTRSGISIELKHPQRRNGGEPGTSGLPTVELFLDAVNPNRQRQAPLVLSPDTLVGGRTS